MIGLLEKTEQKITHLFSFYSFNDSKKFEVTYLSIESLTLKKPSGGLYRVTSIFR